MKKSRKILFTILLVFGVVAVAGVTGFFAGNIISFKLRSRPNYNFDASAYTETIDDIKYSPSDKPAQRTASEAFIIAVHKLNERKFYDISGYGVVDTGMGRFGKLYVWGKARKQEGEINTSIVAYNRIIEKYQVGLRYDYRIEKDEIDFYWGESSSDGSCDWEKPELINRKQYIAEWGLDPTNFFPYTISSKTAIKNSSAYEFESDGKKLYRFSLKLDCRLAVSNYARQLKKMSGLNNYPDFEYVYFDFVVDNNFNLVSVNIKERYSVFIYGVLVHCEGKNEYSFVY